MLGSWNSHWTKVLNPAGCPFWSTGYSDSPTPRQRGVSAAGAAWVKHGKVGTWPEGVCHGQWYMGYGIPPSWMGLLIMGMLLLTPINGLMTIDQYDPIWAVYSRFEHGMYKDLFKQTSHNSGVIYVWSSHRHISIIYQTELLSNPFPWRTTPWSVTPTWTHPRLSQGFWGALKIRGKKLGVWLPIVE